MANRTEGPWVAAPLIDGLRHPDEVHGPNGPVAYISLAVPVEQRHATVSVLSATSGLRTVSESGSQDSQHLRRPRLRQPKRPAAGTANICSIRVLNNPSVQQLEQPTSTVSRFRTAQASSNYNRQHLQHPGFAQQLSSATEDLGICSIRVSYNRSVHQSHSPAFETPST